MPKRESATDKSAGMARCEGVRVCGEEVNKAERLWWHGSGITDHGTSATSGRVTAAIHRVHSHMRVMSD